MVAGKAEAALALVSVDGWQGRYREALLWPEEL
jgi:hypothetical protein